MTKLKTIFPIIILYLLSSGASFATFRQLSPSASVIDTSSPLTSTNGLAIDPGAPKTEACPLNGQLFTEVERAEWEKHRPIAAMINNHVEARPQSGIGTADIVYEAVAEGGITRFMGLFYCDAVSENTLIAPVRSARTYFVDWASEYNFPLYVHAGGANCSADQYPDGTSGPCKTDKRAQAIEQIGSYGWNLENDITSMTMGKPVFVFNNNRFGPDRILAKEHTLTSSTLEIWKEGAKRQWTATNPDGELWLDDFTQWSFKDGSSASQNQTISYSFWRDMEDFRARWEYDPTTNTYLRFTGNQPLLDLNTNNQVAVSNLVIILTKETTGVDELGHLLYQTIGTGKALLFQDGQAKEITWNKPSRTERTKFLENSQPVEFNRGKVWISVLDTSAEVAY